MEIATHAASSDNRLLTAGVVAGPLFIIAALLQAFTREGFDIVRHALSQLSLGGLGWIQIAEILLTDEEDLVQKATGWMLRTAGGKDRQQLLSFLDQHAAAMPRRMLNAAMEKLGKEQWAHYRSLKK